VFNIRFGGRHDKPGYQRPTGHHCVGENLPLMSQLVFDWLDEIFMK
jgi:hypothetical protein